VFEKMPTWFKLSAFGGILLAGPATLFAFLLGGSNAGIAAVLFLFFLFIILYMIAVRKYL